jgi:hypothetical protein
VAPLGSPDHALLGFPVAIHPVEHLVEPGAGHVDGDRGVGRVSLAAQHVGELDARNVAVLNE